VSFALANPDLEAEADRLAQIYAAVPLVFMSAVGIEWTADVVAETYDGEQAAGVVFVVWQRGSRQHLMGGAEGDGQRVASGLARIDIVSMGDLDEMHLRRARAELGLSLLADRGSQPLAELGAYIKLADEWTHAYPVLDNGVHSARLEVPFLVVYRLRTLARAEAA